MLFTKGLLEGKIQKIKFAFNCSTLTFVGYEIIIAKLAPSLHAFLAINHLTSNEHKWNNYAGCPEGAYRV